MQPILSTLKFIAQHPLSSKQPLTAFWRYGRWQIESRLRQEVEFDWIESSKLIVRKGMTGATGNIYCGLHEFADMAFLLHLLRAEDVFVDIGANVGSYTVLASAVCGAKTIAVEPDPNTMKWLKRNLGANGIEQWVQPVEAALGAEAGTAQLTLGLDTVNRISSDAKCPSREVQLSRLDDIIGGLAPCFIKMDVEGYEAEVLRGGGAVLKMPSLLALETESTSEAVVGPLEAAGFERWYYEPFTRRLSREPFGWPSSNGLFIRNVDACSARIADAPRLTVIDQLL